MCHVYQEHIDHFGEPDDGIVFDHRTAAKPTPEYMPSRLEIVVWHPTRDLDITTFSTIGMSEKPMAGADYRTELHFAIRSKLTHDEMHQCARWLANVATYPFHYATNIDWWHKLRDPGAIPLFPGAHSLLFYPRFVDEGWDLIHYDNDTHVKLLNVIPISADAYKIQAREQLAAYVWDDLGDPFTPW